MICAYSSSVDKTGLERVYSFGMREAVERVLGNVRQALRLHAGGIELVEIIEDKGLVKVRLTGTCEGCALSQITLKNGVEAALCQAIPEVREVIAVS